MTINVKPPSGTAAPATPTQIAQIQSDLNIATPADVTALINANTQLGAMAPAVQTLVDLAIQAYNTGVNSQIIAARTFAVQRANHTGTQLASTVVFATGETLESQKVPFLTQGTAPSADAPNLTTAPTIAGTTSPGSTLTTSPGSITNGSGGSTTSIYQWQRVDVANGAVDIFNATNTTYVLQAADNGFKITVKQTVKDAVTGLLGNTRSSLLTSTVAGAVPGNSALPTISPTGSATAGTVQYTSTTGTWTGSPSSFGYQWYIAGVAQGTRTATTTFTPNAAGPYGAVTVGVIATNGNGASTEAISTTSVTTTAPAGTGHRWTNVTSGMWTEIRAEGTARGDPNTTNAESRVAAIPSTGGTLLSSGGDVVAAINAVGAGGLVRLGAGTYTLTGRCTMSTQKLVCMGNVTIDARNADIAFNIIGDAVISGGPSTAMTIINGNDVGIQCWNGGAGFTNGAIIYHVSVDGMGAGVGALAKPNAIGINCIYDAQKCIVVSCEAMNGVDDGSQGGGVGGNSDGFRMSNNSVANAINSFIDCHAYRNSDDGFDGWQDFQGQFLYFCTSQENAKHPTHFSGDGNGFKLGDGTAAHNLYKCATVDNKDFGYNRNGNTVPPRLNTCSSTGDDSGPYAGGAGLYTIV